MKITNLKTTKHKNKNKQKHNYKQTKIIFKPMQI